MTTEAPNRYWKCQRCGTENSVQAIVSNEIWNQLKNAASGAEHLCLACMDEIATSLGLSGRVKMFFVGNSLHGGWDEREHDAFGVALKSATDPLYEIISKQQALISALAREVGVSGA